MSGLTEDGLLDKLVNSSRASREESAIKRLLNNANRRNELLEQEIALLTRLDNIAVDKPEWSAVPKSTKRQKGIANLLLSDLHLDEVVNPLEMRGKNAYNRDIALKRMKKLGANTVKMGRDYISGVSYDGLYVWANGDFVSGNIHAELKETNDSFDVVDTVDYWVDPVAAMYCQLADYYKKVHVVVTPGNHGRNSLKPVAKGGVRQSFDWLLMRTVYRELKNDKRFTWNMSESLDVRETQYEHRYLMVHGDDFKGGDQIAGAVRPVMMGDYRTLVMEITDGEPYDTLLVGHFHQYTTLPRAVINGSLKGYDEYAKRKKFRPEVPKQAFWVTTPEYGPSFHLPILPMDRDAEGW